ncbi:MAG: glutathione S-transferase N-terminal domain-containing protein [Myxococcales bacterium]|nr:glutathione S-transferase N-terminal domain-containing protein [Myxococcales bacterium]
MIDLHYFPTPNGWKASIALEELELEYRIVEINIGRGDQFAPEFLAISPNNRIPAIVDHDPVGGGEPVSVFESGAILLYLAEKTGRLLPKDVRGRIAATEWLMWQMAGLGPMLGQLGHFKMYAPEPIPYALERYGNEAHRLYRILDERLAGRDFVADEYSVADIASWSWVKLHELHGIALDEFPNARRWYEVIDARPAVARGVAAGMDLIVRNTKGGAMDEESREHLFGQR